MEFNWVAFPVPRQASIANIANITACPYDNGAMESFFSSFKQEDVYRTSYRSVEDCKAHIAEYMGFYNSKRPHRANNYKTPDQTEELYYQRKTNRDAQTARFES